MKQEDIQHQQSLGSLFRQRERLSLFLVGQCYELQIITLSNLTQELIFISTFFAGDDQHVAIQMRGGPEPLMVTGWMQIMSLDPSYIGTYHCIATNALGQVYSLATVGVYKNEEL